MQRSRHTTLAILLTTMTILLAACGGDSEGTPAADGDGGAGETVSLAGNQFSPTTLTVAAGTTVTFTDTATHTVTEGTNGVAEDDPIVDASGGSDIEVTFDEAGTYNITCTIHPEMNMTITVEG